MIFSQPYDTSSVIKTDFYTNKNEDQWSEAQTLLIFDCNLGLSKIKQFQFYARLCTVILHCTVGQLCNGGYHSPKVQENA